MTNEEEETANRTLTAMWPQCMAAIAVPRGDEDFDFMLHGIDGRLDAQEEIFCLAAIIGGALGYADALFERASADSGVPVSRFAEILARRIECARQTMREHVEEAE